MGRDRQRSVASVYDALAPAVLGYFRSQRAPEPEDLTGEVFVRVTRSLNRFDGDDAALRRWVFTLARNVLIDAHRRAGARPQTTDDDPTDVLGSHPAADPPATTLVDPDLIAALDQLSTTQREVVVLRYVAELPVADVAKVLRKRRGAVQAAQARALARLEEILGSE